MEKSRRRRVTAWRSALPLGAGCGAIVLGLADAVVPLAPPWQLPLLSSAGFVLAGGALVARAIGKPRVAACLALVLTGGGVLVLAHHAAASWSNGAAPYAGATVPSASGFGTSRPAVSTAAGLVLAALAILLDRRSPAIAWSLGIGVLALAVLGLGGRLLDLHATFVGMMPLSAAMGCALLGVALGGRRVPRVAARGDLAARYTPYAAGATCLLATILFWQSLVAHQRLEIQRMVEVTAVGSLAELGAFVSGVSHSLERLAEEWKTAGRLPAASWRYQSRLILERLGGPRAVEWIDPSFDVVYVVVPSRTVPAAAAAGVPMPPVDDAGRRALTAALAGRRAVATPTFTTDTDTSVWRLAAPLTRNGEPDGFVSALFATDEMFDDLLATRIHDYVITVYDGDRQIYGPRAPSAVAPCHWCRAYTLDLPGGRSWELWFRPSAELLAVVETSFPQMILAAGILISLLLTAMLRFLQRARRTARDLAHANRALHDEVVSRRTAEQEIRTLATELEQRVRERTAELAASNTALRTENALRQRTQATLESANGNLRHFASFVSHELRQPLATMGLWTELLESNPDAGLNDRGRGYLQQLRSAIDRMSSFLEAQLRLARVTYTQPTLEEDVDVAVLVREIVADSALALQLAGSTVDVGTVPTVRADSGQLRQLFRNLIENAAKYRRPGVPLQVRVEGTVTTCEGARHCEIRLSDNGQGFAEQDAEKIFDLFEQLPGRKAVGSGVGLAICRRIVEHHGGTIRAEGRPGVGATFIIELPLQRCEGHHEEAPASAAP
jgi:signal transduction histidine kinase